MTQYPDAQAHFAVVNGEQITVTVTAVETSCATTGSVDGTVVLDTSSRPGDYSVYTFQVIGNAGDVNSFACTCTFAGTPPAGKYEIGLTSDKGGSCSVRPVYADSDGFNLVFIIQ
jgi:hypothetical protein